jgi:hypothetical protein
MEYAVDVADASRLEAAEAGPCLDDRHLHRRDPAAQRRAGMCLQGGGAQRLPPFRGGDLGASPIAVMSPACTG